MKYLVYEVMLSLFDFCYSQDISGTWSWMYTDSKHMSELVLRTTDHINYTGFYCSVYNDGKRIDCPGPSDKSQSHIALRRVDDTRFSGSFSSPSFGGKGEIKIEYFAEKKVLWITILKSEGEYYLPNNVLYRWN